ncbi:MAG: DUF5916 domain-containing protein [Acidobacteriota bacterium]
MQRRLPFYLFFMLFICVMPVKAWDESPKVTNARTAFVVPPEKSQPVPISRFDKPPVIDGRLDEDVWKNARLLKDFYQISPGDNIAPSQPTDVLIGYDAKFLYIAFRAYDEPGKVRATVAKRDGIFDDDNVGVYLDTFNDQRRSYEFFFNPLGVQADGVLTEGRGEDFSVDIVMESKGMLTENGYQVETAIPFKSLRYEAGKEKLWGVHFFRRIKRFNNELNSWMPISRDITGYLPQAGHIVGFEDISTERTLEIIPSLTVSETGKRVRTLPLTSSGRFVNAPLDLEPGLTMKVGISPNITLDFALNPDFAQVEADQTVVTANQRFPIFFEEKRPFFLEGIDIFRTPLNAVHTRAIIDPDYAVKLTGKRARNTFGLLLASDNAPGNFSQEEREDPETLPRIAKFLDKNAYIGVIRLKRDIGKESSLGFIATSYNFIERHNQLGGFDGRLVIDPKTVFTFQILGTNSRRFFFDPAQGRSIYRTGNAIGYSWNYDFTGRTFGYFVSGEGRSRDYRADVGFTRQTGINSNSIFLRFSSEPKASGKFISWRVVNLLTNNYDWQGREQRIDESPEFTLRFARQTFIGGSFRIGYERLFEEEFGSRRTALQSGAFFGKPERTTSKRTYYFFFETTPSKKYSVFTSVNYDRGVFDFDFGAGPRFPRVSPAALANPKAPLDPGAGNLLDVNLSFAYQPTDALRVTLDYTKSKLTRRDTGRVAFDTNIYSLRATYQFTRFTFVRARIDYETLFANAQGQFLFGWTPNPGTSFYIGYNDNLNINGFSPFTGAQEPGFRRNSRTFFIKMSYLIRRSL